MNGIFIKYGKAEHLKAICDGTIRFAPSDDYVKMEQEQHNKGQGDLLDGKWVIHHCSFVLHDYETGEIKGAVQDADIVIQIEKVNQMPIFCLSHYDSSQIDGNGTFTLPETKLNQIKKDFESATHALVIENPDLFIEDVSKTEGHKVVSDLIHYYNYDINSLEMPAFLSTGEETIAPNITYTTTFENRYRHLLCKDKGSFGYQDEFRFIILDELIEKPKFYKIDFRSSYKIVPIDDLGKGVQIGDGLRAGEEDDV